MLTFKPAEACPVKVGKDALFCTALWLENAV
jgi:hypothetical protein